MSRVIVCRFGELFLKSGNRRRFEAVLHKNMRLALAGIEGARVEPVHGRVFVHVADDAAASAAADRLQRVFGLVSISIAAVTAADLEEITQAAVALAKTEQQVSRPKTFKVEARRTNKKFPYISLEIARHVGGRIIEATGLGVDVHHPELRVGIEVAKDRAFVYAGERAAPGGLPVGVSGRALLLLSGGIDSPVAGWLSAKRGLALDAVYFHSPPYIGEKSRDKVLTLGRMLASWQALDSVTVVGFTETQKRLREAGPPELAVVLYRRMMMRIADQIADQCHADGLITGENLGQVASQTIQNMAAIEAAARHVVLRPLVTFDKVDTIALARRIGTYETSVLPFDDCCSLFVPRHPATSARIQDAERAESKLDIAAEVSAAVAAAEKIMLSPRQRARGEPTAPTAPNDPANPDAI
ncbi:MAG: tRNA 4-thiouridine(8) synthase ThiI [Deltaproteobacteria bacterium]|nr:tRNA 4-thiouridine(8) synthase ThiI [Deltaproteobacteria bacterium]